MPDLHRIMLIAGLMAAGQCLSAERNAVLRSNPFLQPAQLSAGDAGARQQADPRAGVLELRATMVAGRHSQANIGGVIIGLGGEVNGYRLVEVFQRHVVLDRDGIEKEISIDDVNKGIE